MPTRDDLLALPTPRPEYIKNMLDDPDREPPQWWPDRVIACSHHNSYGARYEGWPDHDVAATFPTPRTWPMRVSVASGRRSAGERLGLSYRDESRQAVFVCRTMSFVRTAIFDRRSSGLVVEDEIHIPSRDGNGRITWPPPAKLLTWPIDGILRVALDVDLDGADSSIEIVLDDVTIATVGRTGEAELDLGAGGGRLTFRLSSGTAAGPRGTVTLSPPD